MENNENKEKTGKFTKHDLWCYLAFVAGAFCWSFFRGKGWLDWLYNLAPELDAEWVEFIVIVIFALVWLAISAIYSAIRKKKENKRRQAQKPF